MPAYTGLVTYLAPDRLIADISELTSIESSEVVMRPSRLGIKRKGAASMLHELSAAAV
jgi:hypothetical protein